MKSKFSPKLLMLAFAVQLLSSCATKGPPKIVTREGDNEAIVFLKGTDLKQGDHLVLLSEKCEDEKKRSNCVQKQVGHATVLQRLNDKYARVRFDGVTSLYEGQPVEEHKH